MYVFTDKNKPECEEIICVVNINGYKVNIPIWNISITYKKLKRFMFFVDVEILLYHQLMPVFLNFSSR